jgi:signal transduction histidine kinase
MPMQQLKKDISKAFIIYAFLLSVIESVIDSIFDDFLFVRYEQNERVSQILLVTYLVLCFATFILFAYLFTKLISKKISFEMHRQIEERNMIFTNIAHDLKTPITSILGFSRALREKEIEPERQLQVVDTIYEKSKRTSQLINTLFHYSKLETDAYELQREELDVCRLTRDIVASQYEMLEEYGMELEVDIPEEIITYSIDKVEYTRVISNLLVNACIHNERGCTILVKIEEEKNKNARMLLVVVADNGIQIDVELKNTMFDAFASGDDSRSSKGGSGLGLAISKSIVKKHGGNLILVEPYKSYTKAFVIELKK